LARLDVDLVPVSPVQLGPDADLVRDGVLADLLVHCADGDLLGGHGSLAGVTGPDAVALGVAGQLLALHHVVAVLDERLHLRVDRVGNLELVFGDHTHLACALLADDLEFPIDLGDDGLALGDASLEQLLHAGQTLGDVDSGDTTCVEGTHRQLGTRLADRLGCDDSHRLTNLNQLAGGQVATVASAADALAGLAHEYRPHLDRDARGDDLPRGVVADGLSGSDQDLAIHRDVLSGDTAGDLLEQRVVLGAFRRDVAQPDSIPGAAVLLAHDHVLGDVDETPRQVAGVGGPERGVRQTLPVSVCRDEVLENCQAFGEVGLDRKVDDPACRVGHQATHTRQLADLLDV